MRAYDVYAGLGLDLRNMADIELLYGLAAAENWSGGGAGAATSMLLLFIASDGSIPTYSGLPAGWTQVQRQTSGSICSGEIWYLLDDETATTFSFNSSVSANVRTLIVRVAGCLTAPEATSTSGTSSSTNAPSLTPSWGSAANLWMSCNFHESEDLSSTPPTNYTIWLNSESSNVGVATRALTATTDDPGAWALAGSGTWAAMTCALKPDVVGVTPVLGVSLIDSNGTTSHQVIVPA